MMEIIMSVQGAERVLELYFISLFISAACELQDDISVVEGKSGYQIKLDFSCSPLSIRISWPVMLRLMFVMK